MTPLERLSGMRVLFSDEPDCADPECRFCAENGKHRARGWRVEWKPEDLWVGVFWRRTGNRLDVWVCLLPCLPIHLWREL